MQTVMSKAGSIHWLRFEVAQAEVVQVGLQVVRVGLEVVEVELQVVEVGLQVVQAQGGSGAGSGSVSIGLHSVCCSPRGVEKEVLWT